MKKSRGALLAGLAFLIVGCGFNSKELVFLYLDGGSGVDADGGFDAGGDVGVDASVTILAPTGVNASDGTYNTHVLVSWDASVGATSYIIYRDDAGLAEVTATSYEDIGAAAPPALASPTGVTASRGEFVDKVRVTWSGVDASVGATHAYAVRAKLGGFASAPSDSDTGYRRAAVTGYEILRSGADAGIEVEDVVSYDDFSALPGWFADAGRAVASDGTFTTHVALSLTGATAAGPPVSFQVRAKGPIGAGSWSLVDTGYRGANVSYRWQVLRDEFDPTPSDLDGGTGATHVDTTAPASGQQRWYRCRVSAVGSDGGWSAADIGYRKGPSDSPIDKYWEANSLVREVAASDGVVYIGGFFTYVGPQTGSFVAIDEATGKPTLTWLRVNGDVRALAPDDAGGWYIGGAFTSVNGLTRNRIAHLLPNGEVDPGWNPNANGDVRALAISGGTVFVGGSFATIGDAGRSRIAALDADGGATPWNPNANGGVVALVASGATVYAGGYFTSIGAQTRNRIAAIDGSGAATPWNPNANDWVNALGASGSTIYAAGNFTSIGDAGRNRIAAIDGDGGALDWNPNANSEVFALTASGETVYVGGNFTTIGAIPKKYFAVFAPK